MNVLELDTLNRLGIVLNFAAGFLLTPELLGRDRIERIERRVEIIASRLSSLLTPLEARPGTGEPRTVSLSVSLSVVLGAMLCFGIWIVLWPGENEAKMLLALLLTVDGVYCLGFLRLWTRLSLREASRSIPWFHFLIVVVISISANVIVVAAFGAVPLLIPLLLTVWLSLSMYTELSAPLRILVALPLFAFMWPLFLVGSVVLSLWIGVRRIGSLLVYITDPERPRLRDLMVSLGIAAFILGNALQLIATYE
jgi:hypothetical protein